MSDKLEEVEEILDAISACVKNRCYPKGSVMHIRYLLLEVREDLAGIERLLLKMEGKS